jgi:Pyruvate/2-oxoacid:ferredoxin oxidoreductase delta subunit
MLVDLNLCLKPRLHIMDGVMAMQGNGPRSGTPLAVHALLISADPVALDATMARLMDMDPTVPPTAAYGLEFGLGTYLEKDIVVLGDTLESLRPRRYKAVKMPVPEKEPSGRTRFIKQWLVPKPVISQKRCTRCGTCVQVCPVAPKAVNWTPGGKKRPPQYDYSRCIRCYCCQELCPERAIKIKTPLLGAFIRR